MPGMTRDEVKAKIREVYDSKDVVHVPVSGPQCQTCAYFLESSKKHFEEGTRRTTRVVKTRRVGMCHFSEGGVPTTKTSGCVNHEPI